MQNYGVRTLLTCFVLMSLMLPLIGERHLLAQQAERGQGVRIKVQNGQEIDLYDESHALVIGVSNYTQGWHSLPGVSRDVAAVVAVLERQGFKIKTVMNPTRDLLDQALRDFISDYGLRERNRLLVYFAGHGYTDELSDGRDLGYIVPADAPLPEKNPALFNRRAVSMDEMDSFARRIRAKHALFVFDSCFSGSIFESRGELRVPPEIESKTAAPVRQFITSGTKKQAVPDDSIFRAYFVRAFDQREGDLNGDGFISGEELGMYLAGRVASDSRDTQTPRFGKIRDARLNLGDFVFALPKKEVPPPVPLPTPSYLSEQSLWETVRDSSDQNEIERYTRKYCPNGIYCDAAEIRLARLKARPAPNTTPNTNAPPPSSPASDAPLISGLQLEMVNLPGGTFTMGSNDYDSEKPPHQVTVAAFAIGKYEVTQAQWQKVMGNNPSSRKGDNLPVENVTWEDAQKFCLKLGNGYRLPTEAEWEYAARAGSSGQWSFGNDESKLGEYAWFSGNSGSQTHPVGQKKTNGFGLFDMHGNVWEWCEDDWHNDYNGAPTNGSAWKPADISKRGSNRVLRGGSWDSNAVNCRSALRGYNSPGNRYDRLGFRLARTYR